MEVPLEVLAVAVGQLWCRRGGEAHLNKLRSS